MIELGRRRAARGAITAVAAILALVLSTAGGEADTSLKTWFTDSAGRRVEVPAEISRVLAAGPPAAVLLYSLAPDRLVGWPHALDAQTAAMLPRQYASLPVVGRLTGHGGGPTPQAIMALHPDIIIDIGDVNPTYAALADRFQQQIHIPYVLLDGRLSNIAQTYRLLGKLLSEAGQAETLATYAEQTLARLRAPMTQHALRVYYARGSDGLATGAEGSLTGEFIRFAGAINVAAGGHSTMKTSLEKIQGWNPDAILTLDPETYGHITTDTHWAALTPVKNGRVHLPPQAPFGWIDEPPGVNRLLGIQWLAATLYPGTGTGDIRAIAKDFCSRFYHVKLSDAQLAAIFAAAH